MIDAAVVGLGRVALGFQRDPLRLGVVTHVEAWMRHPLTRLVGGVDPDPVRRQEFEAYAGVPAYADWTEMFAKHAPRLVSVCTRPELHADAVLAAVSGGAERVICEKPCTVDLRTILALCDRLGGGVRRVGVNFQRRFDPLCQRLAAIAMESSVLGGTGVYTAGLRNTASHWIEWVLSAGADVESVLALPQIEGEDPSPNVIFKVASGGLISLLAIPLSYYSVFEADLLLSDGRVRISSAGAAGGHHAVVASPRFSGYSELSEFKPLRTVGLSNSMLSMADDAVRSLLDDKPMTCTILDAVRVHRVIDAVDRSLATGTWVDVDWVGARPLPLPGECRELCR